MKNRIYQPLNIIPLVPLVAILTFTLMLSLLFGKRVSPHLMWVISFWPDNWEYMQQYMHDPAHYSELQLNQMYQFLGITNLLGGCWIFWRVIYEIRHPFADDLYGQWFFALLGCGFWVIALLPISQHSLHGPSIGDPPMFAAAQIAFSIVMAYWFTSMLLCGFVDKILGYGNDRRSSNRIS